MFRPPPACHRLASLLVLLGLLLGPAANAQKPKELQWSHAFDLAARKLGEAEFTKDTQKFGVEAFKDTNTGLGVYISQTGSLACAPGFQTLTVPVADSKGPEWLTGLDLPARKAGQKEFTKQTKVHSLEVFRDPNTNAWLYVTEKGELAAAGAKGKQASGSKAPKWVHSVDLSVRKGGVKEWKDAAKFGVEVYRDGNTGNLVYVCETGAVGRRPGVDRGQGRGEGPRMAARPRPGLPQAQRAVIHEGHAEVRRRGLPRRHDRQPPPHQRDRQPRRRPGFGQPEGADAEREGAAVDARPEHEGAGLRREGVLREDARLRGGSLPRPERRRGRLHRRDRKY